MASGYVDENYSCSIPFHDGYCSDEDSITQIEALNVLIAIHTLARGDDDGGHIAMQCDNSVAVHILSTSKCHNPHLLLIASAAWMLQAACNIHVIYSHKNVLADALSRAHASPGQRQIALASCLLNNIAPPVTRPS